MWIKRVKSVNFMAFAGTQEVVLPIGPIAIVGRYTENPRKSNWSGKSAWLEAIRFALTGAHRKRTDDAVITYGADRMEVELETSTGVIITRSRPRGGPTVLRLIDPTTGLMHERESAEQLLSRFIRLSVEDFDNTSWFGQGDVQALCAKTSGVRREVFARWLELDLWERMGKRAQLAARDARTSLEVARASTSGAPPQARELIEAQLKAFADERAVLEAKRKDATKALDELFATTSKVEAVRNARAQVEEATNAVEAIKAKFATLPPPTDPEELAQIEAKRTAQTTERDNARKDYSDAQRLITGSFDGRCPVTCEACPVPDEVSNKRTAFTERARLANESLLKAGKVLDGIDTKLMGERQALANRTRLIGEMNAAGKRMRETALALKQLLEGYEPPTTDPEHERQLIREGLDGINEQLRVNAQRHGQLVEESRQADAYTTREATRLAQIEKAEHEARIGQLVARALGGSGISARIAAASLNGLEERANALLSDLGLSFTLTWERELADPSPACGECGHLYEKKSRAKECPSCSQPRGRKKSDELDVLVDDGSGEVEDVRAKSGGAKALVASAIRLAGGMMLRERRGSPLEVAFVDEPFGELDLENRDALAKMFTGLLSSVGLEQAFVVSHDAQLLAGLPARLVVTREGSTSRIELET